MKHDGHEVGNDTFSSWLLGLGVMSPGAGVGEEGGERKKEVSAGYKSRTPSSTCLFQSPFSVPLAH